MNKKVINKATTRERKLYEKAKCSISEYYALNTEKNTKAIDIQLNIRGYTNLKE